MLLQILNNQPYHFFEAYKYVFDIDYAIYSTILSLNETTDIHLAA